MDVQEVISLLWPHRRLRLLLCRELQSLCGLRLPGQQGSRAQPPAIVQARKQQIATQDRPKVERVQVRLVLRNISAITLRELRYAHKQAQVHQHGRRQQADKDVTKRLVAAEAEVSVQLHDRDKADESRVEDKLYPEARQQQKPAVDLIRTVCVHASSTDL